MMHLMYSMLTDSARGSRWLSPFYSDLVDHSNLLNYLFAHHARLSSHALLEIDRCAEPHYTAAVNSWMRNAPYMTASRRLLIKAQRVPQIVKVERLRLMFPHIKQHLEGLHDGEYVTLLTSGALGVEPTLFVNIVEGDTL